MVEQWKALSLVAVPAGTVTITLSAISEFLQVRVSHVVQPPPPGNDISGWDFWSKAGTQNERGRHS